ncbi:hypothetical protein AYO21_04389 [Fonsecaea monophora]|uniref:Uncharacterized protein n=1 Tax=Fonsecaea monophora TaxID=254056 RepID=A0A177FAY7_9EURO|nr:hypothetical protein AYO21_04389 [Fonsecaea monophora]KAH0848363.1 hypothetical protein FOPE_02425 [Fonsecaea pedrosoi]OAG41447.1 hypothetical protein AYO21_04389 [Fonsecaea monophora]
MSGILVNVCKKQLPSPQAGFFQMLDDAENDFLVALPTLDEQAEPGNSVKDFSKVRAWVSRLLQHTEGNDAEKISSEDVMEKFLGSSYTATDIGIDPAVQTPPKVAAHVSVGTFDE